VGLRFKLVDLPVTAAEGSPDRAGAPGVECLLRAGRPVDDPVHPEVIDHRVEPGSFVLAVPDSL
jgi:hypothetical protein